MQKGKPRPKEAVRPGRSLPRHLQVSVPSRELQRQDPCSDSRWDFPGLAGTDKSARGTSPPGPTVLTTVHGYDRPVVLGEAGEARRVLGGRAVEG